MKASSCDINGTRAMNESNVQVNNWAFLVLFTLVAIGIASVFAFVGGRSLTQSQAALSAMRTQGEVLRRLEQLVETLPGGVCIVEAETGNIIYVNEGFRTLTQRPSSDLLGRSILKVIPEDEKARHSEMLFDDFENTWLKYGRSAFILPTAEIELPDGTHVKCKVEIRGTRVDGRREWMIFIDPRL